MKVAGKLKSWSPRGHGFISRDDGEPDVFVSGNSLDRAGIALPPRIGTRLLFLTVSGKKPTDHNLRAYAVEAEAQ